MGGQGCLIIPQGDDEAPEDLSVWPSCWHFPLCAIFLVLRFASSSSFLAIRHFPSACLFRLWLLVLLYAWTAWVTYEESTKERKCPMMPPGWHWSLRPCLCPLLSRGWQTHTGPTGPTSDWFTNCCSDVTEWKTWSGSITKRCISIVEWSKEPITLLPERFISAYVANWNQLFLRRRASSICCGNDSACISRPGIHGFHFQPHHSIHLAEATVLSLWLSIMIAALHCLCLQIIISCFYHLQTDDYECIHLLFSPSPLTLAAPPT